MTTGVYQLTFRATLRRAISAFKPRPTALRLKKTPRIVMLINSRMSEDLFEMCVEGFINNALGP